MTLHKNIFQCTQIYLSVYINVKQTQLTTEKHTKKPKVHKCISDVHTIISCFI